MKPTTSYIIGRVELLLRAELPLSPLEPAMPYCFLLRSILGSSRKAFRSGVSDNWTPLWPWDRGQCQLRKRNMRFQAAVLGDCDKRIVKMMVESNNRQPQPFIDPFDRRIYDRAMLMDQAVNAINENKMRTNIWLSIFSTTTVKCVSIICTSTLRQQRNV